MRVLTVPGYTGSGEDHWQSHLERSDAAIVRVHQRDWNRVDRQEWIDAVAAAVQSVADDQVLLVGHTADGYGRWPRIAELIEDAAAGRLWAAPLSPER